MRVLSLWQPWASLVAQGVKTIETRSWSTRYRGPLAIAATARPVKDGTQVGDFTVTREAGFQYLLRWPPGEPLNPAAPWNWMPLGCIVATCELVDVVPMFECPGDEYPYVNVEAALLATGPRDGLSITGQLPYGDFRPGRYAWVFNHIVKLGEPVPFKGGQGLTRTWEP